jgi:hypothetical protein
MPRVILIFVVALASCQRSPKIPATCVEADQLHWIEHANVQEDFRQHVEREHDRRFLSIYGLSFASEFPGLQDTPEIQRLLHEHGSRRIDGTTDVISCVEQRQLLERIFHYAMRYNSTLLGYLEAQNGPNQAMQRTASPRMTALFDD